VNPEVAIELRQGLLSRARRMSLKYRLLIKVEPDSSVPLGEFRGISVRQSRDVTDTYN